MASVKHPSQFPSAKSTQDNTSNTLATSTKNQDQTFSDSGQNLSNAELDTGGAEAVFSDQLLTAQQLTGEETAPTLQNSRNTTEPRSHEETVATNDSQGTQLSQKADPQLADDERQQSLLHQDQGANPSSSLKNE